MAWIEVHQALPTHRKTLALASLLDVDPEPLVGHLVCLWLWALDNAPDGVIEASPRIIARVAGWRGDHDVFLEALERVGFVERLGEIEYRIHDWDDYAGKLVDRRKANAERMRTARANTPSIEGNARALHVQRTKLARVELPYPTQPDPTGPDSTEPPTSIPLTTSGGVGGEVAADAAKTTTKSPPVPLVKLSEDARTVLDFWRQAHGKRSPPKLNPIQAAQLEDAVVDLGVTRLFESVTYMAGKGVQELSKAISAARTKRRSEEQGGLATNRNGAARASPPLSALATLGADDDYFTRDWDKELGGSHGSSTNRPDGGQT